MVRKIAAVGMLALCCLSTGCWFNSPCCSPYDKAGPTFGGDPSIPNDFNYRKGSILGSETPSGGQYMDDGVEYTPDDGTVSDYVEEQPQSVAEYMPEQQPDTVYMPEQQPVAEYRHQQQPMTQYSQPQRAGQYTPQPRRFPGLFRSARPMNQGGTYQGMRDQDGGYQDTTYQGAGDSRSGYQGASTYRTGTNPRYRSQGNYDGFDQEETQQQGQTE